ncbi:MAG TPA: hypothetical protein VD865_04365 [Stenotrophomonas sp.]|nr:hypothetical protein [Stenotrophomonas sp.]
MFLHEQGMRLPAIERHIDHESNGSAPGEDLLRNERLEYEELFSPLCESYVLDMFDRLMSEMKVSDFEASGAVLDGLDFLQRIGAKALWKFHCDLAPAIEGFVREFDRLDVAGERKRLYLLARGSI